MVLQKGCFATLRIYLGKQGPGRYFHDPEPLAFAFCTSTGALPIVIRDTFSESQAAFVGCLFDFTCLFFLQPDSNHISATKFTTTALHSQEGNQVQQDSTMKFSTILIVGFSAIVSAQSYFNISSSGFRLILRSSNSTLNGYAPLDI